MTDSRNPYVGPRTFSEQDAAYFFGREREARDLTSLVIAEPLVLFYAQSGAGKSSLLQARLIPALREEEFVVLPIGRVSGGLPAGVTKVDNIFVFNLLLSLDKGQTPPAELAHLTLVDYLRQRWAKPDTEASSVLVIDQFEEILTTHLDRWTEREGFFQQLGQTLREDQWLWVVLTMREDYVAALDPFASLLPNKLRARFYMQRMTTAAALAAVERPAAQAERPFAPSVAQTLVNNLAEVRTRTGSYLGEFVQPVQLQVVCFQLWQNLEKTDLPQITAEALRDLGDVNTALAQFYEQSLTATATATGQSAKHLRDWFSRELITESGTRGLVFQGERETGGLPNAAVSELEHRYLIRGEWRGGNLWYELTHDRFIEPIQQANLAWYAARRARWARVAGIAFSALTLLLLVSAAVLYAVGPTDPLNDGVMGQQTIDAAANATAAIYQQQAAVAQTEVVQVASQATADVRATATVQAVVNEQATVAGIATRAQIEQIQVTADVQATSQSFLAATATSQANYIATLSPALQQSQTAALSPSVVEAIAQTSFATMDDAARLSSLSTLFTAEPTSPEQAVGGYAASALDLFNDLSEAEQITLFANTTDTTAQRTLLDQAMRRSLVLAQSDDTALLAAMLAAANQSSVNGDLASLLGSWLEGRSAANSGEYAAAVRYFTAVIDQQLNSPILYMDRAKAYDQLGETDAALLDYVAAASYVDVVRWDGAELICTSGSQTEKDLSTFLGRTIFTQPAVWQLLQTRAARYPVVAALARPLFTAAPLDQMEITQPFGANPEFFLQAGLPGHDGVDFNAAMGDPVYAVANGTVVSLQTDPNRSYGINLILKHDWGCLQYDTRYAHLDSFTPDLAEGQQVVAGQQIGTAGQTGNAFGPHLHLALISESLATPSWPNNIADPTRYIAYLQQNSFVLGWVWGETFTADDDGETDIDVAIGEQGATLRQGPTAESDQLGVLSVGTVVIKAGQPQNGYWPVYVNPQAIQSLQIQLAPLQLIPAELQTAPIDDGN